MVRPLYRHLPKDARVQVRQAYRRKHVIAKKMEQICWETLCFADTDLFGAIASDHQFQPYWRKVAFVWSEALINKGVSSVWHDAPPALTAAVALVMCKYLVSSHDEQK